ncbi:MAG: cytochrome D ubiquinol oxidase subunit II, partial [Dolichospermum sp.]
MTYEASLLSLDSLQADISELIDRLPTLKHRQFIQHCLSTILRLADSDIERLDWKILSAALADMERGFKLFYHYRHIRKITIFGSARLAPETPAYQMAVAFSRAVCQLGFMI